MGGFSYFIPNKSSTLDHEIWGDWEPVFGVKISQHVFG